MAFDDPAERSLAAGRFHIENEEFMAAADFALSPSMFSSRRVCVMYNIDGLQQGKFGAVFRDMTANLPDSTILILTSREIKPPAFMAPLLDRFKVVQFWRYFDNDLYNYIAMSIRKMGLAIDDRAVDLLIGRTGSDIKKIDDAIDMIRYSGEAGLIGAETIKNFIDDVRDVSVFEFIDALFMREARALSLFKKLYEDGTPELGIVYQILRQAEMMERYYGMIEEGMTADQAMDRAGVYTKNREHFWRYTESFPRERIRRVFTLISGADFKLKSGGVHKELVASPVFAMLTDMLYTI